MTALQKKGLILAALHLAIAMSVVAKFVYDRETLPRVWVETTPVDPVLPFRGRYVQLRLLVDASFSDGQRPVVLSVDNNRLAAKPGESTIHVTGFRGRTILRTPVAFFIPQHIPDPSRRAQDEQLWVEVSVPKNGLPRPMRLGVKKDGVLTPLDLR